MDMNRYESQGMLTERAAVEPEVKYCAYLCYPNSNLRVSPFFEIVAECAAHCKRFGIDYDFVGGARNWQELLEYDKQ